MSTFRSDNPFMLLAKLKEMGDKAAEYLEIADKIDKVIEAMYATGVPYKIFKTKIWIYQSLRMKVLTN